MEPRCAQGCGRRDRGVKNMSMTFFDQSGQMEAKVEGDWWAGFIGSKIKECTVLSHGGKNNTVTIDIVTENGTVYAIRCYGVVDFVRPRKATESPPHS